MARRAAGAAAVASVLAWLAVAEAGIRLVPLAQLTRRLGMELATGQESTVPPTPLVLRAGERRRLKALALVIGRWPFGPGPCLRQSLVAGRILRLHSPRLRIGILPTGGDVTAHAWLEVGGVELFRGQSGFHPLVAGGTP